MLLPTRAVSVGGRAVFLRVKSHCTHKYSEGWIFNILSSQLVSAQNSTTGTPRLFIFKVRPRVTSTLIECLRKKKEDEGRRCYW